MTEQIDLGGFTADVTFKDIKNVHLSVYPPVGKVRISAPTRMALETVRIFAISKLDWIKQQQRKLREQPRETPREFQNRESHYLWGKRHLLEVVEGTRSSSVEVKHGKILLHVPQGADSEKSHDLLSDWYRDQVRVCGTRLIAKWARPMCVSVNGLYVRQMKTKWGSCNHDAGTIRLNTELAKKPSECLEYIVVHEMVHLLEPSHNARFIGLMDRFLPSWRLRRDQLNQLPVRHEEWGY